MHPPLCFFSPPCEQCCWFGSWRLIVSSEFISPSTSILRFFLHWFGKVLEKDKRLWPVWNERLVHFQLASLCKDVLDGFADMNRQKGVMECHWCVIHGFDMKSQIWFVVLPSRISALPALLRSLPLGESPWKGQKIVASLEWTTGPLSTGLSLQGCARWLCRYEPPKRSDGMSWTWSESMVPALISICFAIYVKTGVNQRFMIFQRPAEPWSSLNLDGRNIVCRAYVGPCRNLKPEPIL